MSGLDAWVYSKPFGQSDSGGDVYYVSSCATGRITRLMVADVAGHGSAVGSVAVDLRELMRRYVNYLDQTRFVTELNAKFSALSRDGCFATALVTTFFAPTNLLSLCNAGHPPPLLYRAADREWRFAEPGAMEGADDARRDIGDADIREPSNLPLGVIDVGDYQQFDLKLGPGDLVFCYTDSLIESRDAAGELLGVKGLLRILKSLTPDEPEKFIPTLLAMIAAERSGNLTEDDVTVLAYRATGRHVAPTIRQRLLAPVRVVRGITAAICNGAAAPFPDLSLANLGGAWFSRLNHAWKGKAKSSRRFVENTPNPK